MNKDFATAIVVLVNIYSQLLDKKNPFVTLRSLADCEWDSWQPWSSCTKTCEGGTKQRGRTKLQEESCGGSACLGNSIEQMDCNTQCCPSKIFESTICKMKNNLILFLILIT